jgi:hypothetical protein
MKVDLHCGIDSFELIQQVYHEAYFNADVDMLNYLQHKCFYNIRAGIVKSKNDFLKSVRFKKSKGKWYPTPFKYDVVEISVETKKSLKFTKLEIQGNGVNSSFKLTFSESWIFDAEVSWKILNCIIDSSLDSD